ncbi:hypothetical protein P171DRAFT_361703 [Karstenula rhodostoma CBS 690.94]|uniref:F-box domain-containing protein n=1 Tax=Karstenula rhodostoma CBS 690.94 TaxID=1392251 RepID=A0A9P4UAB0_9PLEO|nr:hypothetical protein P171DRAFT_361703 [Karstenula rhodostoma CBS 690.94]
MDIDPNAEDDTYALFKHAVLSQPDSGTERTGPPPKHKCFRGMGYAGRFITAEEMRGCNTAQCLLNKAHHSAAAEEPDDQDFEREGSFYLSGLCGHVCSRDGGGEEFVPARHGVADAFVDSWVWQNVRYSETAVPFHPACFDIFSRLSRTRFGYINVEALGNWIFDSNHDDVDHVSSDPNVRSSSRQWWDHLDGCEYLGANPLIIPRLAPILQAAIGKDDSFNPQNGAFDIPSNEGAEDVFSSLPLELRLQTLSCLGSSDIANLRLASRTFRQLPILLWRDLLLKEMPYLWEVWSDDLPFIWATVQFEDVVEHEKVEMEIRTWRTRTQDIIKAELPETLDAWQQHVDEILLRRATSLWEKKRADTLEKMVTRLPALNTNWYKVYTGITRNWEELKGLQNRRRVWKDIGVIVEKLDEYTLPA